MRKKSIVSLLLALGLLSQASVAFATQAQNFEQAWQEATVSQEYSFTCTTSSGAVSTKSTDTLTADNKALVDLAVKALRRYTSTTKGTLHGALKQLSLFLTKLDTLGVLDSLVAKELTFDETVQKMKTLRRTKADLILDGNAVYYKSGTGWKTYEDADFATSMYSAASGDPITTALEKSSFILKSEAKDLTSAVYTGTLTADATTTLLTPFIGVDTAKQQVLAPVKLYIANGHLKKYEVSDKIVLGGLSFTVKEKCDLNFKPKVKVPTNATTVTKDVGTDELTKMLQQ